MIPGLGKRDLPMQRTCLTADSQRPVLRWIDAQKERNAANPHVTHWYCYRVAGMGLHGLQLDVW